MWVRARRNVGPAREQSTTQSICDLQAKLYGSRPAGIGDCPEATGKRSAFSSTREGPAHWGKRSPKRCRESTRRGVDVAIENVEKLCPEVDSCVFTEETRLLTQGEILVAASEGASA